MCYLLLVVNCTQSRILYRLWDVAFDRSTSISLHLLCLTPRRRGSPGTISVKFCTEVRGWLRYTVAGKYCRKF